MVQKSKVAKIFLQSNTQWQHSVTSNFPNINPLQQLQRAIGNRNVQRLLTSDAQRARTGQNIKPSVRIHQRTALPLKNNVLQRSPDDSVRALNIAIDEWSKTVREFPPCSNRGPEVDNYLSGRRGGGTVEHEGISHQCGQPWCAYFIRWCLNRAGISHGIGGAARSVKDWGQRMGLYHRISSGFTPERGDIFFKEPSGPSSHPCDNTRHPCVIEGGSGHAGFILGNWGSSVTTIEGNVHTSADNDGVGSKYRPINELDGVLRIP